MLIFITTLFTSIQTYYCGFYDIRKTTTSIVLVNKTAYRTGTDGVTEFIQLWIIRVGITTHMANLLPTLASAITFFTSPHVSCLLTYSRKVVLHSWRAKPGYFFLRTWNLLWTILDLRLSTNFCHRTRSQCHRTGKKTFLCFKFRNNQTERRLNIL